MKMDGYLYTHPGGRSYNEDSAVFLEKEEHGIYVVADGLGGHEHGELASKCVCDSIVQGWPEHEITDRKQWLGQQISKANDALMELQTEIQANAKSTVVVLTIDDERATWANVGDSRLYYFHDGEIACITEDHSVSYKKYKAGEITRWQIGQDEDQSCLLRSLGGKERNQPDIHDTIAGLKAGDAFLLCTDGVWEYLQEEEMLIDLLKTHTSEEWAEHLLLRVMERIPEDNDNLTLLAVRLE